MSKDERNDEQRKDAVELDDAALDGISGGRSIETGRSGTARARLVLDQ